jgi:hypothetical protein
MKPQLHLILLFALLSTQVIAQQPFAIRPYAITLPRVTTGQQTNPATVPQQAGNMVYNTDQQAVAVNNGIGWGYLGAGDSGFENFRAFRSFGNFISYGTWTPPSGVTRFIVEAWGGGAGSEQFESTTTTIKCRGGGAGGYFRRLYTVTSGAVSITVGDGGDGEGIYSVPGPVVPAESGGSTIVRYQNANLVATGGSERETTVDNRGDVTDPYGDAIAYLGGSGEAATVSFAQRSPTEFLMLVKGGNGGTTYGVPIGFGGQGSQFVFVIGNPNPVLFTGNTAQTGSFPGGGGGCAYSKGGTGAQGLVIIRW